MKEHQQEQPSAKPTPVPITLEDIQRARDLLARAGAALGVEQAIKKEAPIPTHPKHLEDPAMGDKTPAVVEWYRDNDPEEYHRRYAGRKTHLEDRREERPRWAERGHSANDKVRNSQEQGTASRRSLGIVESDTNLDMPSNCANNAFPDHESEVPLLHKARHQ
jgi:hypothetical protein